jgi:hypothetical protein
MEFRTERVSKGKNFPHVQLAKFEARIAKRKEFSILRIINRDRITNPRPQIEHINRFFVSVIDLEKAAALDPSLYRKRQSGRLLTILPIGGIPRDCDTRSTQYEGLPRNREGVYLGDSRVLQLRP